MQERDALRQKVQQQKEELQQGSITIHELQAAAADLADELQSVRSGLPGNADQHVDMAELTAEHAACLAELAAKSETVDHLNDSVSQLHAELAAVSTAQQAQHVEDSTEQQAEFVGQVLQELQVLESALVQKGEECDALMQQLAKLTADSTKQLDDLRTQHSTQAKLAQELQQDLRAQRAQREELAEKALALDAQVAHKQHKLDALQKEVLAADHDRQQLQAELDSTSQQACQQPNSRDAATSISEDLFEAPVEERSLQLQATDALAEVVEFHTGQQLKTLQMQLVVSTEQLADQERLHAQLLAEAGEKSQTQAEVSKRMQLEVDTATAKLQVSLDNVQRLEAYTADLQSDLSASNAHGISLQEQSAVRVQELDACRTALESSQHVAEGLQHRLTDAGNKEALAQAEHIHLSKQIAADKQQLLELQQQLAVAQEDRAALLALPQPDIASSKLEAQALQQRLSDHSSEVLALQSAAEAMHADNRSLLCQLDEARQSLAAAEQQVEQFSSGILASQEQLEQDRDTLMEEVLSAKARAADQERIIQTLRGAAEASARERALLSNQLDATEQQFASQAQELLQQQRESQRLQVSLKDQSMHLKKARFKGSSNDQGLRGMQQRLQEALQDKRAAELNQQSMQSRLQEAERVLSQARQLFRLTKLYTVTLHGSNCMCLHDAAYFGSH